MNTPEKKVRIVQFGTFEVDLKSGELRRNGVPIPIQPAAFKLLEMFVSSPDELIPRAEIRGRLWPEEKDSKTESLDRRLNFEIKAVRRILGDDYVKPRYVQTVRKRGYKFVAPVRIINGYAQRDVPLEDGSRPESGPPKEPYDSRQHGTFSKGNMLWVALTIPVVVGFGAFALWLHGQNRPIVTSVSRILPQPNQEIIIRGRGFGSYTSFTAVDTPYLAIRDNTAHWAAGRIMGRNWDKVTLTVTRWLNSEIDITGFDGPYGQNGWKLNPGDRIEVAVWNPQTGAGPALYHLVVAEETSHR